MNRRSLLFLYPALLCLLMAFVLHLGDLVAAPESQVPQEPVPYIQYRKTTLRMTLLDPQGETVGWRLVRGAVWSMETEPIRPDDSGAFSGTVLYVDNKGLLTRYQGRLKLSPSPHILLPLAAEPEEMAPN
jgi:hypothetical protein